MVPIDALKSGMNLVTEGSFHLKWCGLQLPLLVPHSQPRDWSWGVLRHTCWKSLRIMVARDFLQSDKYRERIALYV